MPKSWKDSLCYVSIEKWQVCMYLMMKDASQQCPANPFNVAKAEPASINKSATSSLVTKASLEGVIKHIINPHFGRPVPYFVWVVV